MITGNLLSELPDDIPEELFQTLVKTDHVKIERILSHGQSSPDDFWYDQDKNEWVLLLEGHACIRFEDDRRIELHRGDYVNIPAHVKHRVEYTHEEQPTVWLVIFYDSVGTPTG